MDKPKFDFNDILITPVVTSSINSRREVFPYDKYGFLPLCTAPMDMVISRNNEKIYYQNGIKPVLPRGEKKILSSSITSVSLEEFIEMYDDDKIEKYGSYLIDIANGHMEKLLYLIKFVREDYPNVFLMVGNIANPETYKILSDAGADAIRCGIGGGSGCSTSVHTGTGYAMGSLIKECYDISCTLNRPALIVADGGMKNYGDIIKAIYLGADLVMIGGILNKCIESSGGNYLFNRIKVPQYLAEWCFLNKIPVYKKMRGMSTKDVQRKWGVTKLKTSEGVTRKNKVEYTVGKWVENFEDYLRSAMSYSGCKTLEEFKGKGDFTIISQNAFNRFNK